MATGQVRMTQSMEALDAFAARTREERRAPGVVFRDRLARIAARGDVVEGACEVDANGAKQYGSFLPRSASSASR